MHFFCYKQYFLIFVGAIYKQRVVLLQTIRTLGCFLEVFSYKNKQPFAGAGIPGKCLQKVIWMPLASLRIGLLKGII